MNIRKILIDIKYRYFRPVIARKEGLLVHHADCHVHLPIPVYEYAPCTCGLNHDLRPLSACCPSLVEKLNPRYWDEYKKQECPKTPIPTEDEMKANEKWLAEVFPDYNYTPPTEEEIRIQDEQDWELITDAFDKEYTDYAKERWEKLKK